MFNFRNISEVIRLSITLQEYIQSYNNNSSKLSEVNTYQ